MSLKESSIANRYAKAFFEVALKQKNIEKIEKDLNILGSNLQGSDQLQQALINPIVSRQEKANIFLQLVKKMNLAQEIGNFLKVLSFNGRAAILPAVIEQFIKICKENRGEVTAQLTIADNLSDAQVEDLEKTLGQALSKTVKIQKNVNKAILGGVILKIGSKMFDSSISGTLKNIELLSKKAIAANY